MGLPLNKRDFDVFLSHAHKDAALVRQLDEWLTEAGFTVWYDGRELAGGAWLATDLQDAITRCRSVLLVATDESLSRGWVKAEYNAAMEERANHDDFRVMTLRVAQANVEAQLQGTTWIDLPTPTLTMDGALAILRAFYPGDKRPNPATARDVYVSRTWHGDDATSAKKVCAFLVGQGFRLIGDATDQAGFKQGDRIERIIASCGAFVGIVPFREDEVSASSGSKPYKYFLKEMDLAAKLGIPSVAVADPRIRRIDGSDAEWLRMETLAEECPESVQVALQRLWEEWRSPPRPQRIFCAMDLDSTAIRSSAPVRHLIERVTGMPTTIGTEVHEYPLQPAIIRHVCEAFLVLADISDDNVNTCIEAGMALAAGANVELIARGGMRRPPFMLRSLQLATYESDLSRLAKVHRAVRPYRRRVINAEL